MTTASVRALNGERTPLRERTAFRLGLAAATAAVLFGSALVVDVPLQRALLPVRFQGLSTDLLFMAEMFGHGLGVLLVLAVVANLDPLRRKLVPWLAACAFGGGLAADVLKLIVSRQRPRQLQLEGLSNLETFTDFLPLISAGAGGQSFPSAHAATAAGLAIGLTWLYPRGRTLFTLLALGVGVQRLVVGAHFLSDVLVGWAIGCLVAHYLLQSYPDQAREELPERPSLKAHREQSGGHESADRLAA